MTDNYLAAPEWCLGCPDPIYDDRRGEWDWYCRQHSPTGIRCSNVAVLRERCYRVRDYFARKGRALEAHDLERRRDRLPAVAPGRLRAVRRDLTTVLGLRDYGVEGQIGLEPTPEEHVEKMVEVFREVRRVLRDDGVLWLNYGDCYAGSTTGADRPPEPGHTHEDSGRVKTGQENKHRRPDAGLKPKDLVGMPWRIAFALQADGWYLRSDIIWSKPNAMPESVTDRPTKSHEYVFLLTKSSRYFYDADAVREAQNWVGGAGNRNYRAGSENGREAEGQSNRPNPAGRNRRTVWEIPTQPTPEAHFATFPEALVEPCIKAGTGERGACPVCGAPWRRVVERLPVTGRNENKTPAAAHAAVKCSRAGESHVKTVGWEPSCGCETQDGEPVPCIVLDPFGGSGTVAKVARDLGRSSILIEINPEYVQIAKKRLRIGEQLDSGVCEYVVKNFRTEATP